MSKLDDNINVSENSHRAYAKKCDYNSSLPSKGGVASLYH